MYAVVRTGGKQYRVKEGDRVKVEKLDGAVGEEVRIDDVLLLVHPGEKEQPVRVAVGRPRVPGAFVEARIVGQGKHRKVWRFRTQEEGWDRIRGHRQLYTELQIQKIVAA